MELVQILSTDCVKVDGYLRSAIYDLTRQQYYLFEKFNTIDDLTSEEINFLISQEVILLIPKEVKEQFNPISFVFESNQLIASCQICYFGYFDITKITELLCRDFAFLIFDEIETKLDVIKIHLEKLNHLPINSVDLVFENCVMNNEIIGNVKSILQTYNFCKIVIRDSVTIEFDMELPNNIILCQNAKNQSKTDDFFINITAFSESLDFNLFYNHFLLIDENGIIKNSAKNGDHFGSILEIDSNQLIKIVQSSKFNYLMGVNKNKIDVCMHCEFQRMCCDDRLPLKRNENNWYYQEECQYNPYICKWQGEEGYLNLEECGIITNEHEFSIDHEKIYLINKEMWGE